MQWQMSAAALAVELQAAHPYMRALAQRKMQKKKNWLTDRLMEWEGEHVLGA